MLKHLRLPDIAGLFCLITFLVKTVFRNDTLLEDGDPFWHIKAGSVMLDTGTLLTSDIFSHTANGTPWISHEWFAEIIMALLHRTAGLGGLVCGALLLVSLTFWILFRITERHAGEWTSLLCVSLSFYLCGTHLAARPHLFTWFFLTLILAILLSGNRWIYGIPIIMMFWANVHGGFVIGLLLQIIFLAGMLIESLTTKNLTPNSIFTILRRPLIVLLLSFGAIAFNPFGFELLLFPLHVAKGVFLTNIAEWKAPDLQILWQFRYFLVFLFLIMSFSATTLSWTERLLFAFFLNAALLNARNISLLAIVVTPSLARNLSQLIRDIPLKLRNPSSARTVPVSPVTGPLATLALGAAFITFCTLGSGAHNPLEPKHLLSAERHQVEELTDFIKTYKPAGNLFNEYNLGGYLLYAVDPPPKVFIDGRADMYGENIFSDYQRIAFSEAMREKLLNEYAIEWVVFERGSSIEEDLRGSRHWKTAFQNDRYVVLDRIQNTHL